MLRVTQSGGAYAERQAGSAIRDATQVAVSARTTTAEAHGVVVGGAGGSHLPTCLRGVWQERCTRSLALARGFGPGQSFIQTPPKFRFEFSFFFTQISSKF